MAGFSANDLEETIVNLIEKNNVTTSSYDVSSGLVRRLKMVKRTKDARPIPKTQYPCVLVHVDSKREDWAQLGRNAKRSMDIEAYVDVVIDMAGYDQARADMMKACDNLEYLFRNYIGLSGTVNQCNVGETEYDEIIGDDQNYNVVGVIRLDIQHQST